MRSAGHRPLAEQKKSMRSYNLDLHASLPSPVLFLAPQTPPSAHDWPVRSPILLFCRCYAPIRSIAPAVSPLPAVLPPPSVLSPNLSPRPHGTSPPDLTAGAVPESPAVSFRHRPLAEAVGFLGSPACGLVWQRQNEENDRRFDL